jgi:Phe-tRNA synthetase beta subunit B1 domain
MGDWVVSTVSSDILIFCFSHPNLTEIATEEFDELCFDFGIELDEDVCVLIRIESDFSVIDVC